MYYKEEKDAPKIKTPQIVCNLEAGDQYNFISSLIRSNLDNYVH